MACHRHLYYILLGASSLEFRMIVEAVELTYTLELHLELPKAVVGMLGRMCLTGLVTGSPNHASRLKILDPGAMPVGL